MRIGLDARGAAEIPGGRGRYVRELVRALALLPADHDYVLHARARWDGVELPPNVSWRIIAGREPLWNVRAARAARDCDVYLTTDSFVTACLVRVPSVVVVHDLIAFDPARAPNRRDSLIQKATLPRALRRAARVICPSEATRRDLVELFPHAAEAAAVVPLGASEEFTPEGEAGGTGLDGPYALAVGTLEPRKNLPRLIEAFAGLPDEVRGDRVLALAGAKGWDDEPVLAAIGARPDIVRPLGYVADAALPGLYRGADAVCYVSLYEGFGLPVLEAMRCGAPVLASRVSSLPEVGGDAVVWCDPLDVDSIRDGLARLLSDAGLREELGRRAAERAAERTWRRTAEETLAELAAAAGNRPA